MSLPAAHRWQQGPGGLACRLLAVSRRGRMRRSWPMSRETRCVSVVIPVYNSAGTLWRAVDSVRRQTLLDLELLIVDDGSCDNSHALACELAAMDRRVRGVALPGNRGKSLSVHRSI